MKKVDVHTAAAVLEDEHAALSHDIRLAQFSLSMMCDRVPDEDYIAKASHAELIVAFDYVRNYLDIATLLLRNVTDQLDFLEKLRSRQEKQEAQ